MRERPDPYCGFKNDRERRLALRSRDVRLGVIALVALAMSEPGRDLGRLVGSFLTRLW